MRFLLLWSVSMALGILGGYLLGIASAEIAVLVGAIVIYASGVLIGTAAPEEFRP